MLNRKIIQVRTLSEYNPTNDVGVNEQLYNQVINQQKTIRLNRTPSKIYMIALCLSFALAIFLIIDSYNRGISLAMDLNQVVSENTENNNYYQLALNVINSNDHPHDTGYTYYVWNTVSKIFGLNRLPNDSDAVIITQHLLQEIASDAANGLQKALLSCGHVSVPSLSEYDTTAAGYLQYNGARAIAYATNTAAGMAPYQCATSLLGSKLSLKTTIVIAEIAIKSTEIISRVSIIKNFLSIAFSILGVVIPSTFILVKNITSDDTALLELREDPTISFNHVSYDEERLIHAIKSGEVDVYGSQKIKKQNALTK